MSWIYRGREFTRDDVEGWIGFVYSITCISTQRKYIGKKKFVSQRSRPPLKGKKRRRRDTVDSDWEEYFGSSEELLADVARLGRDDFVREILHLCRSRGEMTYLEMKEQVVRDVLLKPEEYYNSYVGGRIHRSHVLKKASGKKS